MGWQTEDSGETWCGYITVQRPEAWRPRRADNADEVQKQSAGEFPLAWGCQIFYSTNAF